VLSEFPPGHTVRKGLFIVRNRIISGLSEGILVIEGTEKSGTLTTAKYAADQGKTVFAPPVPITNEMSHAPNILLKQGAVLVTDAEDILREFGIPKMKRHALSSQGLSDREKEVIVLLEKNNVAVDEFVMLLNIPLHEISEILSCLEVKGFIDKDEAGNYCLRLT
jgi:DNA processing protein